jgi:protease-4
VREDKSIKAVVFRINSGGGSAMASENIWRELSLTRKEKPVVVSFGDVAASGGYYVSCNADSIFAQPNTITGSIGVFSILPNMQRFFNDKLGVTFDGVRTGPYADVNITQPLTPAQKAWLQEGVDSIYQTFKGRVAQGRHKELSYIDSIGQGRVWSGIRAVKLGLVDRLGGLNDAIASAAGMAKLKEYRLREYPEPSGIFEKYFKALEDNVKESVLTRELGPEEMQWYRSVKNIKSYFGIPQARMPFDILVQ